MAFFHILQKKSPPQLSANTLQKLGCANCTLNNEKLNHPKMAPTGTDKPLFYFIAEAPGEDEDKEGIQQIGRAGQVTRARIPSKWSKHIRWNNVLRCRPPNNRAPTELEINCCRSLQIQDIIASRPKAVVAFGAVALEWFTRETKIRDVWRGRRIAMQLGDHNFWLYPVLHPSFILRMGGEYGGRDWMKIFSHDLKRLFVDANKGFEAPTIITPQEWRDNIRCWKRGETVSNWIKLLHEFIKPGEVYGFDLETSGLNPYGEGADILTAAVSNGETTLAFPLGHSEGGLSKDEQYRLANACLNLLQKAKWVVAHNAAFEQEWLIKAIGPRIVHELPWRDTMAQAYSLDEREGAKSLDSLTLIHFGCRVKPLSPVDIASNIADRPLSEVLPYNGIDAKACCLLWYALESEIEREGLRIIADFNQTASGTMALVSSHGVVPDIKTAHKLDVEWSLRLDNLKGRILELPEVKKYVTQTGSFNPNTPFDVKNVFRRICGVFIDNTEEETLTQVKHPLANLILEYREIAKIYSTWIKKIASGSLTEYDGRLHPRYSHTRSRTGRTSSDIIQTFPKREHLEVRGLIKAPPGHVIAAFDYGQIQARAIGMMSKDKFLIDAFWTGYDIHGEWTDRLASLYPKWGRGVATDPKIRKKKRDRVKNEWTFPNFFGAQLESVAIYLGIPAHILITAYEEFWTQFSGVKSWHSQLESFYDSHLYVEDPLGRRRHAPMTLNRIINSPIQGVEVDIVLDAQHRIGLEAYRREEPWLYPVMEIHDDLSFYLPADGRLENACELIGKTLCTPAFPWISVPLVVELSIGETWDKLEEVHKFWSTDYGHKREG